MNELITAVQTLGLPAVMVLLEAWYIKYQRDEHSKETERFVEALEKNTIVITELRDRLEKIDIQI